MSDIYNFKNFVDNLKQNLNNLQQKSQYRDFKSIEKLKPLHFLKDNKELISFSCNDYFGLSSNFMQGEGGSGSARLINGTGNTYLQLEKNIANIKNTESALIFGSGYLANLGVISCLANKHDLIIADKLCHACIIDGAKLSNAKLKRYKHNDLKHLKKLLENRNNYQNCFIITETIFSMDGNLAPLNELYEIAEQYNAVLISDDAHGLYNQNYKSHVKIGTFSKAIGTYGGYVASDKVVIDYIKNYARSFVFSTALPPALIQKTTDNLALIKQNNYADLALDNAKYFAELMSLKTPNSCIIPLIIGDNIKAFEISKKLEKNGFLVSVIRPPTVPASTTRLRLTFSALHKKEDIKTLANLLIL